MYRLQILLAAVLTFWMLSHPYSRTREGLIKQMIPRAIAYSPNFMMSLSVMASPRSFSASSNLSWQASPRIWVRQDRLISEKDISKLKKDRMAFSVWVMSSLVNLLLQRLMSEDIFGGQISFILALKRTKVAAIFQQLSSLSTHPSFMSFHRQETARYRVHLETLTFLRSLMIHLAALRQYPSSNDSMEELELQNCCSGSWKDGREVVLCS